MRYQSFYFTAQQTNEVHFSEIQSSGGTFIIKVGGYTSVGTWDATSSSYRFGLDNSAEGTFSVITNATSTKTLQGETFTYIPKINTDVENDPATNDVTIKGQLQFSSGTDISEISTGFAEDDKKITSSKQIFLSLTTTTCFSSFSLSSFLKFTLLIL